jgi:hypothetical protein
MLRGLLLDRLGAENIVVIDPTVAPFRDASTTAAITCFTAQGRLAGCRFRRVRRVRDLRNLSGGRLVLRERLESERRWSALTAARRRRPTGLIELGELCRVHRGQATGANAVWIAGEHCAGLPGSVLFPCITRGRELILAGRLLGSVQHLRRVVDLPEDLGRLPQAHRSAVEHFLRIAQQRGAAAGYLARHRPAWWAVGLRDPAPILVTYMARRAPVFTRNLAQARHLNIAHGLYPREPLTEMQLRALVDYLSDNVSVRDGRTYAGGLTKFEPGELQRLLVPPPAALGAATL